MKKRDKRAVLVVEDLSIREKLAQAMSQQELEIVTCEEPEAVEALLSHGPVDILMIDLPLGIPLTHHIASNYPETVLVGISKNSDPRMLEEAEKVGVQVILEELALESSTQETPKGSIQHFERLENFLTHHQVGALLQPIVSLQNSKEILGFESLARPPRHLPLWNPETLFAYAARKEYLLETDLFCLKAAFKEAVQLPNLQKLFVNLRPRSITHHQFAKRLLELCQETGIRPQQLVFELTEQQSILNIKTFLNNLDALRSLGFEIALDDFGTGFANLQWLYDLKPDYLKIAGMFCRNLESDKTKQILLLATVNIADQLQIPTVLENIETHSEYETAKSLGIGYGQGYHFFKPTTAQELVKQTWFA